MIVGGLKCGEMLAHAEEGGPRLERQDVSGKMCVKAASHTHAHTGMHMHTHSRTHAHNRPAGYRLSRAVEAAQGRGWVQVDVR